MKLFGPSWKTTLGGILAAVGLGLRHAPIANAGDWADCITAVGVGLIGLSARDNNVSSERAGIIVSPPKAEAEK